MKRFSRPLFWALLASLGMSACGPQKTSNPPARMEADGQLLSVTQLLKEPVQYQGRISPNGEKVSWLADQDGALNLFVADSTNPAHAKQETSGPQGVKLHYWTPNSAYVLFSRSDADNKRVLTWALNVASGAVRQLGPNTPDTSVRLLQISGNWPNSVLVSITGPQSPQGDLYRINLSTGEAVLARKNPGYASWIADDDLQPRFGIRKLPNGGREWDLLLPNGGARKFLVLSAQQAKGTWPLQMDSSGTVLYLLDSSGDNLSRLLSVDLYSGKTQLLAQAPGHSIYRVLFHPVTGLPVAYAWEDGTTHWRALDPGFAPALQLAKDELGPHFVILASTADMGKLVVYSDDITKPGKYSIIDRVSQSVTTMFETAPKSMMHMGGPSSVVHIPLPGKRTAQGYYSLPNGLETGANAPPLVIMQPDSEQMRIHYTYNALVLWLVSRGYAVLQVNPPKGGFAHDDLARIANWARETGKVGTGKGIAFADAGQAASQALQAAQSLDNPAKCVVALDPDWGKMSPPNARTPVLLVQSNRNAKDPAKALQYAQAKTKAGGQIVLAQLQVPKHDEWEQVRTGNAMRIADEYLGHCLGGKWQRIKPGHWLQEIQLPIGADELPGLQAAMAKVQAEQ